MITADEARRLTDESQLSNLNVNKNEYLVAVEAIEKRIRESASNGNECVRYTSKEKRLIRALFQYHQQRGFNLEIESDETYLGNISVSTYFTLHITW